jgi:ABC-type histidine transport system ATPase subunit
MGFAREVGDRVLFMDDGRIVEEGNIEVKPGFDPALLSQVVRVLVSLC